MAHAERRKTLKQRKKKITSEQKWQAKAIQLDQEHREQRGFRDQAVESALNWATRPGKEFSDPEIRKEVLSLLSACRDPVNRDILAESFREAADACDEERNRLMRNIADMISSGAQLRVDHFLQGFSSA